jgi:hypothetical protein
VVNKSLSRLREIDYDDDDDDDDDDDNAAAAGAVGNDGDCYTSEVDPKECDPDGSNSKGNGDTCCTQGKTIDLSSDDSMIGGETILSFSMGEGGEDDLTTSDLKRIKDKDGWLSATLMNYIVSRIQSKAPDNNSFTFPAGFFETVSIFGKKFYIFDIYHFR